ncbi:hypothetical protein E6P78_30715 [Streptomyces sp. A0958]|uniref:hypothetical protein n=1 Tax=Streptomyces sp. A0958 TaxID=2563101 RepID=UPI00109EC23F|nr:hypothetical protein [Streptomyces sp. A0958]THA58091.1 hypothetical protein E6P78_30715 [Streptomyces sp. A0958]
MRDSIARALLWVLRLLLPARGKRRAVPAAPVTAPTSRAAWSRPWQGPSAEDARAIFHAEETRSLTPEQRERWWAAAFSEIGVDYDFPTMNITGARSARQGVAA